MVREPAVEVKDDLTDLRRKAEELGAPLDAPVMRLGRGGEGLEVVRQRSRQSSALSSSTSLKVISKKGLDLVFGKARSEDPG